ncbi:MAG: GNA1162 family protein, partial [Calditrichota bacterium]
FSNESHAAAAGYAVQNQFVAQLMSDGYSLIEPARAQQILYETRCGAGEISVEAVNVMRRELGADFILTGTVETYSGAFVPDWGDDPEVSMQVRLIDAAEGTIAWSQTASRRGSQGLVMFGYGATHGLNDLSRQLVRSLVHAIPHTTILEANSVSNATGYAQ